MIALGLTFADARPPAPLRIDPADGFAIVAVKEELAATPRDRLRLQVLGARACPSFLPLAIRDGATPPVVRTLLRDQASAVAARLECLAGRAQVTADARRTAPHPPGTGADGRGWLRGRALRAANAAEAEDHLREAIAALGDVRVVRRGTGVHVHALAAVGVVDAALCHVAARLGGVRELEGWQVSVTGPWPAFAFAGLSARAA